MAVARLEEPAEPIRLDPPEIMELAGKRRKRFSQRDLLYDLYELYYRGASVDEATGVLAANSQGRPLLRDLEGYRSGGNVYSAQRLPPVIDDYQAIIGGMPNSRVDPPDSEPAGETHADLATKFLISTHEISDMDRQQMDAGFDLPAKGDACYTLEVDTDLKRVVWNVVDPRIAYPEFGRGRKRFQVSDLIIQTIEDPDVIHRDYGFMPKTANDKDCLVTIYTSALQRTVVIGSGPLHAGPHRDWDLGFCPAQWVFNKVNGNYAQSDIAHSLQHQDFMDFAFTVLIDGMIRNTYGTIVGIKNANNFGQQQIVLGPNPPPIDLQDDGDIIVRQIGGDPTPALKMIEHAMTDMNAATGTSQVRQEGQVHGAVQTGRAMHAAQGPQSTRIELKQRNIGAAIRGLNAMTIEMQVKAPWGRSSSLGDQEFSMFGRFKGKSFVEKIKGKDLIWGGEDGEPWTRNTVTWDAMIGLNLQQKEAIAAQMVISEMTDDIAARELMGIDDPIGMRHRITAMKIARAQADAQVQAILGGGGAQPPGGAPGGAGGGGGPQPTAGPGGQPPSPPAQAPITRPPELAAMGGGGGGGGLPTGVPQGITRKAIEGALAGIAAKLKGSVFAVGELALSGQSQKPHLVVAEWKDQPLVVQTLKPLAPSVKVTAIKGDVPPEAIKVA